MRISNYVSSILARDAAKFEKTPAIKASAQKKVDAALTDEVVSQIQEHARKDAQVKIYQQSDYIKMINQYKEETVSPNRQEAISRATFAMSGAMQGGDIVSMLLGDYSMKAWMGPITTAEVYAPNGEMIAGFNSDGSGWTEVPTEAEYQFMHQADQIYREAYEAARAEIKAGGLQGATSSDIRAQGKDNTVKNMDTFVSDAVEYKATQRTTKLTDGMAASLAKKYDVKHMTRNEYGSLLKDLRDSGVISSQDFSTGYGGAVPYLGPTGMTAGVPADERLPKWPLGNEKADFTTLLRSYAQYCNNFDYPQGGGKDLSNSMAGSYNNILEAFEQIDKFR